MPRDSGRTGTRAMAGAADTGIGICGEIGRIAALGAMHRISPQALSSLALLCLAALAVASGCGGEGTGGGAQNNPPPAGCNPGKIQGCICAESGEAGVRVCGESRYWSACDCSGKHGSCEGDVCVAADVSAAGGPGSPFPSSRSELAGGAVLESPNYRLRLFVAPARPVHVTETKNYRLILGPGGTAW